MNTIFMNIHFWLRGQYAIERATVRESSLPPTARIQTGEPGVWPWAEECKKQLEGLGSNALAYVGPSRYRPAPSHEKILSAARLLRDLAECDAQPILFQARKKATLGATRRRRNGLMAKRMKIEFKTAEDLLAHIKGRSAHIPLQHCPRCNGRLDRAAGSGLPKAGDLSLCCHCEAPCAITDDLHLRLMSDAEVAALPESLLLDLLNAIENSRTIKKARNAMRGE